MEKLQESYRNKTILILTPFRNEDHSILMYVNALKTLDYPKELIDVFWLENDSSDKTLEMLEQQKETLQRFHSVTLETDSFKERTVHKRRPGAYWKDIPYGGHRRGGPWLQIWNKYFLPLARASTVDYILIWFADAIPPENVITEYLKIFEVFHDAGWVGGECHRRHSREYQLCSPKPRKAAHSTEPTRVKMTAHVWMNPREALSKCKFHSVKGATDMHFSLMRGLNDQGLYAYFQPSVYIKHISTDGKIYRTKSVRES